MTLFDAEDAGDRSSSVDRALAVEVGKAPPSSTRLRMTVAYDGSGFHGFAYNAGVATVAGALRKALAKVLGHEVDLTCAGRTDKGVHAWGQVVHLDVAPGVARETPAEPAAAPVEAPALPAPELPASARCPGERRAEEAAVDLVRLQRSLNRMLAPKIVVREVAVARPGFDARRSAIGRRYRYTVLNRPLPDPFLATTTWHVVEPLDVRAMQLACDPLIGEHDWSAFCRRVGEDASLVRVVRGARWLELGDGLLRFDIEANAFCQQMVRSLVGTLVAVGRGRLRAGDIGGVVRSRDRALAAQPAPPQGLCLWEALYPPNPRT
ncbi:MAG TPA: tRNA pseudouridine(38-40) synthase TruA [Acidimicrobiales bacterium]|nr:tRNA pseudouridine(38-40) synthase TruA [Acidimicrobiales bacterium]